MKHLFFLLFLFTGSVLKSQNLIVNPGAEVEPLTLGWTQVAGNWQSGMEVTAHGGTKHFYAGGNSGNGSELIQDIDVSGYASNIDAGISTFTFVAWMRVYNFSMGNYNDRGRAVVEYRNAASAVLSTYDTGNRNNLSWTSYTDSRLAPVGTRTIRIRLFADRMVGSDADGYFDDLSLTHSLPMPVSLLFFSAVATEEGIALHWQTANEQDNDFFTVEKSIDGENWILVDTKTGLSSSQQLTSYQLFDEEPLEGLQYYRLIQTDINGTATTYPAVAKEFLTSQQVLTLSPNPSAGPVRVFASGAGQKRLRVWSMNSVLVLPEASFDGNDYILALDGLTAGYYVIEVITESVVLRETVVRY